MCAGCLAAPPLSRPLRIRPYGRHRFNSHCCIDTFHRVLHEKELVRVTLMWWFQGVGQPGVAGDQHFPSQAVHPDPLPCLSKRQLLGVQQQRLWGTGLRGHGENTPWFRLSDCEGYWGSTWVTGVVCSRCPPKNWKATH